LAHVLTAGRVAARLGLLFDRGTADLLVVAATLHDIGYSARIRRTGFHPLDGAAFLLAEGYPPVLARLVANHSLAPMHAGGLRGELGERFPPLPGLLAEALAYADMHSSPSGQLIRAEHRLADIAARHPERVADARAGALRVAVARVGEALLAAPRPSRGQQQSEGSVPRSA
jgi:hypothetical protein